jgi:predicted SAM-dependent methyltransferase/outer membrane murein-binding lipoprotein Lpp
LKKCAGLLIRAIKHPRQAYCRLSSAISVATAELTTAAVSAKIAELSSAVQTRDAQLAELSSAVQTEHARIAKLTSASFANAKVAPAFPRKLHVGCGKVKLPGWLNIDVEPGADLVIDVRQGLPFEENSVDFIYNEHFVEHLTYEEGEKVLREFWRCLKKGGVLRIATPDLDFIVQLYSRDFKNQDWFPSGFEFVKTKGMAMNMAFRWWGHQYLYNEEDLTGQLIKVGFQNIKRCELNKSNYPELSNLETRKESTLILESVKE